MHGMGTKWFGLGQQLAKLLMNDLEALFVIYPPKYNVMHQKSRKNAVMITYDNLLFSLRYG